MSVYDEIITKSLIDFEEIKFILANNNIDLIESSQICENYFLSKDINLLSSNYNKILDNCYFILSESNISYLVHKVKENSKVDASTMRLLDVGECKDFLNHIGYNAAFCIEKNVYEYSNGYDIIRIVDILNLGTFLHVKKENSSLEELKNILDKFAIPYNKQDCNVSIEKEIISKIRRYH